jgi:RNase H
VTEWLPAWKARGWRTAGRKPVMNGDLWRALEAAVARHAAVHWRWARGHKGHVLNERVDRIANQEAARAAYKASTGSEVPGPDLTRQRASSGRPAIGAAPARSSDPSHGKHPGRRPERKSPKPLTRSQKVRGSNESTNTAGLYAVCPSRNANRASNNFERTIT